MGRNRLLILAAFAAGGFAIAHGTSAATLPPVKLTASCADLKTIDFSRTHFPPMRLDSAEMVTQGDKQFCAVKGYVASQVNFDSSERGTTVLKTRRSWIGITEGSRSNERSWIVTTAGHGQRSGRACWK